MDDRSAIQSRYWRRVLRLTGALLGVWLLATAVGPWFARDLSALGFLGFPFSFWVASQGALLLYLAIIVAYALLMDRLDEDYRREEWDASHPRHD